MAGRSIRKLAIRNLAAAATVFLMLGTGSVAWAAPAAERIVLGVIDYSGLAPSDLARAEAEASRVYARIGVDVTWTTSSTFSTGTDVPVAPEDRSRFFTVLILSRTMAERLINADHVQDNVLGRAVRPTRRANIFMHRVDEAARGAAGFATLLGKVIAHEVGHLLLPGGHTEEGIMQGNLYPGNCRSLWFSEAQGAEIRSRLSRPGQT